MRLFLIALLTALPAPQAPGLKAQETLMGPRTQRVYLSEDGDHIAIVNAKGSRQVLLIDGVEGPIFDEIPSAQSFPWMVSQPNGPTIAWSPTGGRSAYVARRAGDFIAVVDGKEAGTLLTPAEAQSVGYSDPTGWGFYFSPDGSHLAYAALSGPATWVMVLDGVKSPPYHAFDLRQSAYHGKRLVYVAQTADKKWHAVVDGKVGPGYDEIAGMKLTADGLHYAYIATRRSAAPGTAPITGLVVTDGVESAGYPGGVTDLEQAPDGRVAYMVMKPQVGPGGNPPHLIVAGLDAPWTTTFGVASQSAGAAPQVHVAWSPDGKRVAYVQQNHPNPGVTVMVNGKAMGQVYQSAGDLVWSPDGARLFYVGRTPTGTFPVLDGQELSGYNWIKQFQWSPDGKRYAFQAGNNTGQWMIVDGKEQLKALGFLDGALRWSPDGKHLVYSAQSSVNAYQPVVDGVPVKANAGTFAARYNPNISFPVYSYSPDGAHLAYVAQMMDGTGKAVVHVDAMNYQGPTPSYLYPSWSPDSKHFAVVVSTGNGSVAMLDGKLGPTYESLIERNPDSCRFVDTHTFRFFGVKAGQIYRVTLDLGA